MVDYSQAWGLIETNPDLSVYIDMSSGMLAFNDLIDVMLRYGMWTGVSMKRYYYEGVPQRYNDDKHEMYVYANRSKIAHCSIPYQLTVEGEISVLIISDCGSATNFYSMPHIERIKEFLTAIYGKTKRVAWLNPIPKDRWDSSCAYIVKELVDMFEMTLDGLQAAIPLLMGHQSPKSSIINPELLNL